LGGGAVGFAAGEIVPGEGEKHFEETVAAVKEASTHIEIED